MQLITYPKKQDWAEILRRPSFDIQELSVVVAAILREVKVNRDNALRKFTKQFDGVEPENFLVSEEEFMQAEKGVSEDLKQAIRHAKENIEKFHQAQIEKPKVIETTEGVFCWRKSVAIEKVGLYVPSGTAPLFSTVLMLAIPAKIAGCGEIILCSPPDKSGLVNQIILYTAKLCGVTKVFRLGGAQAIGAMAFGTESVPQVYKIFGPGNLFVTEAKQQVGRLGVAIDIPAGPSEVAVLADKTSIPEFVAADLLSQAEHGTDSQVLLVSTDEQTIKDVLNEVNKQLSVLPRKAVAEKSLQNSRAILVETVDEAVEILNEYAAEHLILAVENADEIAEKITNAGSVFIGNFSCEAAGDYASGTNHTLPTNGYAKAFGGVSVDSFVKKITFQKLTEEGILSLGKTIETMAKAENLEAHARAVSVRLAKITG
jgi:histidinol dehydrogenase